MYWNVKNMQGIFSWICIQIFNVFHELKELSFFCSFFFLQDEDVVPLFNIGGTQTEGSYFQKIFSFSSKWNLGEEQAYLGAQNMQGCSWREFFMDFFLMLLGEEQMYWGVQNMQG